MLEWAHKKAYEQAAMKAKRAFHEGDKEVADEAERQMAAVREIDQESRKIFEKHNVPDIELEKESTIFNELSGRDRITQKRQRTRVSRLEQELAQEDLQNLSFGQLLRYYREFEGLTQAELSTKAEISASYLSRVERGIYRTPKFSTTRKILAGFGWEEDAPRAQFLLEKNRQERPPRQKNTIFNP